MSDLSSLDARSFHAHLASLLRAEFVAQGSFLAALAEFDRRKSFRDLGHASLFDYLHRGLNLSRGAAHHRRAAAWLVERFPEVLEPIGDGRLCFTTASILATVMTEENRAEVLPKFYGLSKREALEVAAELRPRKLVPERTVVTRSEPAVRVEVVERTEADDDAASWTEGGQKVHLGEFLMVLPEARRPTVVPMTATESRLHITVSREFLALLKRAKAGQSHVQPGATDEQVLKAALEALIEKQEKRRASVPPKVKREVLKRDGGKCTWPLADGGTCGSTVRLQVDHVVPRGKGGPSTTDNCRVLCAVHNLEAARQAYGDEVMNRFAPGKSPQDPVAQESCAPYGPCASSAGPRPGTATRPAAAASPAARPSRAERWRGAAPAAWRSTAQRTG